MARWVAADSGGYLNLDNAGRLFVAQATGVSTFAVHANVTGGLFVVRGGFATAALAQAFLDAALDRDVFAP